MKKLLSSVVLGSVLGSGASLAQASVLTFDDIGPITNVFTGSDPVPNGYGGLHWSNIQYLNATDPDWDPSGYVNGLVSGNYAAFNTFGNSAVVSSPNFTFEGAYFTAAWYDDLTLLAQGYKNGVELFNQSIVIDTGSPVFAAFNFIGIDTLVLSTRGGIPNPSWVAAGYIDGLGDQGEKQFAVDNFTVSSVTAVPVPAAVWLFGSGIAALAGVRRKKLGASA